MVTNKLPSCQEFIDEVHKTVEYFKDCGSSCDVQFEMARWQDWVLSWPPILDENGGL